MKTLLVLLIGAAGALQSGSPVPAGSETPADAERTRAESPTDDLPELDESQRLEVRAYFAIADYDSNGWISYREARLSMDHNRLIFAGYDRDADGRIRLEEFERRYRETLDRGGGFEPPKAGEGPLLLPSRNPAQLRTAFDITADGALELFEIEQLLEVYAHTAVPADVVMEKLDNDGNERLDEVELEMLSQLLRGGYHSTGDPETDAALAAASIEELFGRLIERDDDDLGGTQHPPMIRGPVSPFRRLDLDNDGHVTPEELERLRRPQTLSVRVPAVLAALDADGDGVLTRSEFLQALDN